VQYAGVSSDLPLRGGAITESFSIEGRSSDSTNVANQAGWYLVSSDYFRALGVPLLQGRDFTEQDSEAAPRVVIINQVLARRFWPGEDAIGRRLKIASEPPREIVGVAGDTRHMALDKEAMPEMYVPYAQAPYVVSLQLVVRTPSEPKHLAAAVRDEVLAVNPNQPVSHVKTMEQYLDDSVAHPRFRSILLGLFGALALVLAMVGLYGVMSYAVTQRTHEIGIRMALGARSRDVRRLVLKQGLGLTLLGVVIGLAGALSLTRVLKTFLFQVSATDPLTLAVVSLLLILIALLACLLPVRRAMAVDPMVALRYE
jgi:predicted permease